MNRTHIGRFGHHGATATLFAERAIAMAAERGRGRMVVAIDLTTGDVYLCPPQEPARPGVFLRGVAFDSDPDVLADDLREEAHEAGLIEVRIAGRTRRRARRAA